MSAPSQTPAGAPGPSSPPTNSGRPQLNSAHFPNTQTPPPGDNRSHHCSVDCPARCLLLEHSVQQYEADQNRHLGRTYAKTAVSYPFAPITDWQEVRLILKRNGATDFALKVWDTLREHIDTPPIRLLVNAYPPGGTLPFDPPPDVDRPLDGARRLLELLDQKPDDISEVDMEKSEREGMTNGAYIRRMKKRGMLDAAHIARLEKQEALLEEARIDDCWQKKYRQFWYVVLYMALHTSPSGYTMVILVEILDRLYGLCYNHKDSCPGRNNQGSMHHFRCPEKSACQSELENPFKCERYLWFWERLPECWNAYEYHAPVFQSVVDRNPHKDEQSLCKSAESHKGPMWTMHSNCIPGEDFAPYAPTKEIGRVYTCREGENVVHKKTTPLSGGKWIRLNAFLARFVRLRGEDKPFAYEEGGKHYMVLWLKGFYTMIEAFEVSQDPGDRIFKGLVEEAQRKAISENQLKIMLTTRPRAMSVAQLQIDNEILVAALAAACVWITLGRLTATYLDKNSRILREYFAAQIDQDKIPGYRDIRWGRHPYATGDLQFEGLLMDWDKRYNLWHRRLNQIIDDHSANKYWLFILARKARTQIMEDWLEQEIEYYDSQPVGSLREDWEREIGWAVGTFRGKRSNGRRNMPNSAAMPTGPRQRGRNNQGSGYNRLGASDSQAGPSNTQSRHQQRNAQPNGVVRNGVLIRGPPGLPTGPKNSDGSAQNRQGGFNQQGGFNHQPGFGQQSGFNHQAGPSNSQPRHQQWRSQGTPRVPPGFEQSSNFLNNHSRNQMQQGNQFQQQNQSQRQNQFQQQNRFQQQNGRNQNQHRPLSANQQQRQQQRERERHEHDQTCDAAVRLSTIKKLVTDQVIHNGRYLISGNLRVQDDLR